MAHRDQKIAVVTGAARGIGAAVARGLSARGMRVVLLGRELESLREVAAGLPGTSCCIEADVTDEAAMQGSARSVAERLGPASVVVANAGIAVAGSFASCDAALWNRVIEVNLIGSAVTARVFLPQLLLTRGYLLQVASSAAFGSAPMMSAYCASKAGVESFAQALRSEMEPEGVSVGIAYLHWTDTDMIDELDEHVVLRELRRRQPAPARRVHAADRVAELLVRGIERRSPTVYAPPWLRLTQPLRPLFPHLVARASRRSFARMSPAELHAAAGVLGAGGHADWDVHRRATSIRPTTPPQD
ncbi:SDR family oxidoreductase [Streptomyces cocklensis]|uniref:Short-chain dehydrogenase n=1 Tax=Actinacidiphila cocklensis TaxID=887465 RepID=A0A9W4DN96_9ACTN|nr:SDR family oxidoreductase [Actinacidiphila cocklensis]MDD1058402.1 SDR family oxidoreductase [Actinacidiphila cocklensis]CAG6390544.1 Short-chain dehydrogenase [Actinacidiphila cocklensis]